MCRLMLGGDEGNTSYSVGAVTQTTICQCSVLCMFSRGTQCTVSRGALGGEGGGGGGRAAIGSEMELKGRRQGWGWILQDTAESGRMETAVTWPPSSQ